MNGWRIGSPLLLTFADAALTYLTDGDQAAFPSMCLVVEVLLRPSYLTLPQLGLEHTGHRIVIEGWIGTGGVMVDRMDDIDTRVGCSPWTSGTSIRNLFIVSIVMELSSTYERESRRDWRVVSSCGAVDLCCQLSD